MRTFKPEAWKKKEMQAGEVEDTRRNFEHSINGNKIKLMFMNIGLGEQKTARSFWVHLPIEMAINDILMRIEKAFEDLKNEET